MNKSTGCWGWFKQLVSRQAIKHVLLNTQYQFADYAYVTEQQGEKVFAVHQQGNCLDFAEAYRQSLIAAGAEPDEVTIQVGFKQLASEGLAHAWVVYEGYYMDRNTLSYGPSGNGFKFIGGNYPPQWSKDYAPTR